MFEIDDTNPIPKIMYETTKTSFDVVRNSLIVASLGYLYEKSHSIPIQIFFIVTSILLGAYIAAIFLKISFKKKFFSDTTSGNTFRGIASLAIAAIVSLGINIGTSQLIKAAIAAQSQQSQSSP